MPPRRRLTWDGCLNVRDLGGHATEDGGRTRFRAVVRADSAGRLTEAGWAALSAYGVERLVDLREDEELAADPPRALAVEVVHVPFVREFATDAWDEARRRARAEPDPARAKAIVYLAALEHCALALADALRAVADAPRGPVVVHCAGGKDRTGLVAGLLLRLCGVCVEDVDADYAVSAANLRTRDEPWAAAALDEPERERRRRIASSPAGAMSEVLRHVERRHGSAGAYLAAVGVAPSDLDRLRGRLLG